MRGKRSKLYRKLMQQFGISFGFREPYQVLVDSVMIQDTQRFKMDLAFGLERTLGGKVKPMITQCCIRHLYNLTDVSRSLKDTLIFTAKSMERRRCNHQDLEDPLTEFECLSKVIDPKGSLMNKHRYVVASQDQQLRRHCRAIKGVPLVYVKRSVMVMEPMSEGTMGAREGMEKEKFKTGLRGETTSFGKRKRDDRDLVNGDEESEAEVDVPRRNHVEAQAEKKTKSKGLKGPNPLSVKKSKKAVEIRDRERMKNPQTQNRAAPRSSDLNGDRGSVAGIIGHASLGEQSMEHHSNKRKRRRRHKAL